VIKRKTDREIYFIRRVIRNLLSIMYERHVAQCSSAFKYDEIRSGRKKRRQRNREGRGEKEKERKRGVEEGNQALSRNSPNRSIAGA